MPDLNSFITELLERQSVDDGILELSDQVKSEPCLREILLLARETDQFNRGLKTNNEKEAEINLRECLELSILKSKKDYLHNSGRRVFKTLITKKIDNLRKAKNELSIKIEQAQAPEIKQAPTTENNKSSWTFDSATPTQISACPSCGVVELSSILPGTKCPSCGYHRPEESQGNINLDPRITNVTLNPSSDTPGYNPQPTYTPFGIAPALSQSSRKYTKWISRGILLCLFSPIIYLAALYISEATRKIPDTTIKSTTIYYPNDIKNNYDLLRYVKQSGWNVEGNITFTQESEDLGTIKYLPNKQEFSNLVTKYNSWCDPETHFFQDYKIDVNPFKTTIRCIPGEIFSQAAKRANYTIEFDLTEKTDGMVYIQFWTY